MPSNAKSSTAARAAKAAAALAAEMGYEFVDVELSRERDASFLRVFIDHEGGMDLELCEAFHRRLNGLLGELDFDYLEVSSPGIDRPLKQERDYLRAKGKRIEIRLYRARDGQKAFSGELIGLEGEEVLLHTGAEALRFALKEIAKAAPLLGDEDFHKEG
ncbi:MAG: ribosome maturation factor RimP [Christensenellaceae bacterium]|nr:ribosome maturation factor RimP [Christensenellaceae bacterium]